MMNKQRQSKLFFDLLARFYDWFPLGWWLRRVQKKVIAVMNPKPNAAILDIGCGTGSALKMLLDQDHKGKLVGVDFSPKMLEKARQKLGKRVLLYHADVARLPFKTGSFDFVICTEAFHHFPDPEKAMKEMMRVMKKGGKLYLADVSFIFSFKRWLFQKIEPGCVHIYSKQEFKELFQNTGFQGINQHRLGLLIVLTRGTK
ncbi:class I SAM-dependent methyltransferase [Candidatus Woesearchaeota archaeon]|nr:class I SAM-dependent methyltransferase [Candidatus Woesearchaeota archaeon]